MLKAKISTFCAAATAALVVASATPANATVTQSFDPSTLNITITNGFTDSFFSNELPNFNDATVLNYVDARFAGGLVQIGTSAASVCNAGGPVICNAGSMAINDVKANVFAAQYNFDGASILIAFQYAAELTHFGTAGVPGVLNFVRAYCSLDVCSDAPAATPLPGAVWLFGTALAGAGGLGAWRRRRENRIG
jgi:hypothetical protein